MIGTRLGGWSIEKELGRGGMGTVYLARKCQDQEGPDIAAIKVLAAELAVEVGFQQRFQREITILRQLDHPNIIRLYQSGSDQQRFWYAMELIDGESYEDIRGRWQRLPWKEVLEIAWQITPALKHAHDRGVIHRDLKPSNLLRHEDGSVKLTDFGIASLFASPHLTVTGGVIGTPEYLSPEQASGKPVTRKSDLYSLGVVLYTLVTGRTPFSGDQVHLLHKHQYGQVEKPSRIVPDLHPEFEEIILQLLEKDPGKRPPDASILFKKLDSLKKKLQRQTQAGGIATKVEGLVRNREGPATLMSRLMRQELESQNRPGPIGRFINHPAVLVSLFLLCMGILGYTFWPKSPAYLFEKGSALMASDNPEDWENAWYKYLGPLEEKVPDNEHQAELAAFKEKLEAARRQKAAESRARWNSRMGEAEWFYFQGLRARQM
ncbi:MAG: serine/threonine protein kinase, partial [Gemmataceae bacterium]